MSQSSTLTSSTIAPFAWLPSLYFVLASLIGLICMVVGCVMILNTLLTQFVFVPTPRPFSPPPMMPLEEKALLRTMPTTDLPMDNTAAPDNSATDSTTNTNTNTDTTANSLTRTQLEAIQQWQVDYANWEQQEKNYDYENESRKRTYANALALLVVGLPVFAFHVPQIMGRK